MKIISLFFFVVFSFAEVKVFTTKAKEINNTIFIKKPYIIYNDEFFVEADRGVLKGKKYLLLEGNVTIFYQHSVIYSNRIEIFSKENIVVDNSFYYDRKIDIWFKNKIAKIKNNTLFFKDTIFSSCCVKNPDWYIFAKSGSFNRKSKSLKLYNLTLFIYDKPVFYFPFFFSSFNKQRRSGLLRPYIGFSAKEGFLYSQPIYIVTSLRSDLEFDPTIRTRRGKGIYATFRFVDSPYSFGFLKAGIFRDSDYFFRTNDLAHQKHFGYQFNYKRDKVFSKDKLYIDIKYANDVDYFYLDPRNYTFNKSYLTDKIITSTINYIKDFNESILGIYNRYFIDTSLLNNEDTLQILPQINYHIFERKRVLLTSFDYNYYNYYSENKRYYINTFLLPVGYNFNVYKNYLNLKVSEIFRGEYGNFYNSSLPPSYFLDTYTQFKLYTSLIKKDDFIHILSPSITLNLKNYNVYKSNSDIISNLRIRNSISFDLFEIYQKENFYIDHNFHQFYNLENRTNEDMENQLNLIYKELSITENNKFSWKKKRTVYNAFGISYGFDNNKISLSHIYQYDPKSKSVDVRFEKGLSKYKKAYFEYNYDMINKYPKFWLFGVSLNKKCWQYDLSFKKSLTPVLKEDGISYNVDYILSINLNFYPIGGLKQYFLLK